MIYADHNATTPCLPEVVAAMHEHLLGGWGNPGSRHAIGRRALAALDHARAQVAALVHAHDDEIVFTSGATEALNLALFGIAARSLAQRPRIVVGATEHSAVLAAADRLGDAGAEIVRLSVDADGRLAPGALSAIDQRTALVALMYVNHETGVIHDVTAAEELAHAHGALLLTDVVQALGKLPVDVRVLGADLIVGTAHKLYGPQGAGFLWLRRGLGLEPQLFGGGQERGLRPGTPGLPGIIGLGVAAELATRDLAQRHAHLVRMSATLESRLLRDLPGLAIHGAGAARAPGTTMITLPGLARGWLAALSDVAASGGSTCAGGTGSATLAAMGVPPEQASNALRLSLGIHTSAGDVEQIADAVVRAARALRP